MKEIELKVTVSPTLGMRVERQGKGFAEAKCFGNILKKILQNDLFICEKDDIRHDMWHDQAYLDCHKATVQELIQHFNNK